MLVRRFIGRRLAEYYAQPSHKVVGRSTELEAAKAGGDSNRLSSLLGEWHWKRVFRRIYEEREGHWLTPVELFQPHYSYILGDFCARYYETMVSINTKTKIKTQKKGDSSPDHDKNSDVSSTAANTNLNIIPFEIVELGGGRGTNANWILSYLKENKPHVYSALTSYTLVDSSPSLHKTQIERFLGGPHAEKVRFDLKDLVDVAQGTTPLISKSDVPTVVMGMEVLDNLPHDKIRGKIRHKLEQAEVVSFKNGISNLNSKQQKYSEKFVPLSDTLLKLMLRTVPNYYTQQSISALHIDACWVPSVACGVLHHAIHQRPTLGLILADFDWLPDPDLDPDRNLESDGSKRKNYTKRFPNESPAEGSPIVTDMEGKDHESYLTAPPHCDILFPTDFHKLASFVKRCLSSAIRLAPSLRRPSRRKNSKSTSPSPLLKKPSSGVSLAASKPRTSVVRVEKQSLFLERWGPKHVAKTKSWLTGHTPLLHDFVNCSVLTISPEEQT